MTDTTPSMLDDNNHVSIAAGGVVPEEGDLLYQELMGTNFLTYAVSVLTDRALPDIRDGLLPVQRRILLAMNDLRLRSNTGYRKCAKVVGECFVEGALVHTPEGLRAIESLDIGDCVLTPDGRETRVTATYQNPPQALVDVALGNGKTIPTTPGQLFMTVQDDGSHVWCRAELLNGKTILGIASGASELSAAPLSVHAVTQSPSAVGTIKFEQEAIEVTGVKPHGAPRETFDVQVADASHAFIVEGCIVHNCMGNYHPHGDLSIYGALVRMAQDFSLRAPLVDGHGNFGNLDGDGAAASRYTECRLTPLAESLLGQLSEEILPDDYGRNYDESRVEARVLPAAYPNLLINGNIGIAVGMVCTMLPHNPSEVLDLAIWRLANSDASIEQIVKRLSGPDFPTGAMVVDDDGLRNSYLTGEGKVTALGEAHIEPLPGNREKIVITSLPYQVSKGSGKGSGILEVMAKQYADGKYPEWTDLNDVSTDDTRIEIELKRGSNARAVLQRIYKYTRLKDTYGVRMNVLIGGRPTMVNLQQLIDHFLDFRRYVLIKIAEKRILEIEVRLHKLDAYLKALSAIDAVVDTIKKSKDRQAAKPALEKLLKIDEQQSQWIVEMALGSLTALDQFQLKEEARTLREELKTLTKFIKTPQLVTEKMVEDFKELKKTMGSPRKTKLVPPETDGGQSVTDFSVPAEDCMLLLSEGGQVLAGQGNLKRGASLQVENGDRLVVAAEARTDEDWVVFTASGKAYRLRLAEVPLEGRRHKGQHLSEILSMESDDKVITAFKFDKDRAGSALFVYASGAVKRTAWSEFGAVHASGVVAAKPAAGDRVVAVRDCPDSADVVLLGSHGKGIRFHAADLRLMGRAAAGVRGINLPDSANLVGFDLFTADDQQLFIMTSTRFAKRLPQEDFPSQGRGGGGVTLMKPGGKYGEPAFAATCTDTSTFWLQKGGKLAEYPAKKVAKAGRAIVPKVFEPAADCEAVIVRQEAE